MINMHEITCYLAKNATDPFQQYILHKEIMNQPNENDILDGINSSKWYCQLVDEQWEDGSYGAFHSMNSNTKKAKICYNRICSQENERLRANKG